MQWKLDGGKKYMQCGVENRRITLQVVAQAFGQGQHPLAHGEERDDVISQMRGGLDHAAGSAGRADASALAGVGDQKIMATVGAAGTRKAVGVDAAFEVTAEFTLDYRWRACSGAILLKRQPSRKVRLHDPVDQRALGLATAGDGTLR